MSSNIHESGASETADDTAAKKGHRLEDLLAQVEGRGYRRNGHDDILKNAADAGTYYAGNDLAIDVLRSKYLAPGETGPLQMWDRIARAMASVEKEEAHWYNRFFTLLLDFKFIPGGRVMHGAGRDEARRKPTLSNCYVIPIEQDSLEGIYRCLSESAMVYRTGGGVGTDLSSLRPKGAPVNATVDRSPGCTAFMNLLSESTNAVSQAGRRGALMLTLRVDHPDIEDFITIKNDVTRTKVQYANISVLITHEFMEAVLGDTDFDLRWGGKVYRTVRARDLWNTIIANAHSSAEPGIIFWDTMKEYHNVEYANPLTSTNPCGEQPLASYTACNLGNLNLVKFVHEDGTFDFEDLAESTRVATRFLDDVIDYNMDNHALPKIREAVESDRRVGLGITGLADALILMKLRYDSDEGARRGREGDADDLLLLLRDFHRPCERKRTLHAVRLERHFAKQVHSESAEEHSGPRKEKWLAQRDPDHGSSGRDRVHRRPDDFGHRADLLHQLQAASQTGRRRIFPRV